jgi:hypothetical protein
MPPSGGATFPAGSGLTGAGARRRGWRGPRTIVSAHVLVRRGRRVDVAIAADEEGQLALDPRLKLT